MGTLAEFLGGTGSSSESSFEAVGTDCPSTSRVDSDDDAMDESDKLLLVGRRDRSIQPFGTDFRKSHCRVFCHLCCLRYSTCTCEWLDLLFRLHTPGTKRNWRLKCSSEAEESVSPVVVRTSMFAWLILSNFSSVEDE